MRFLLIMSHLQISHMYNWLFYLRLGRAFPKWSVLQHSAFLIATFSPVWKTWRQESKGWDVFPMTLSSLPWTLLQTETMHNYLVSRLAHNRNNSFFPTVHCVKFQPCFVSFGGFKNILETSMKWFQIQNRLEINFQSIAHL